MPDADFIDLFLAGVAVVLPKLEPTTTVASPALKVLKNLLSKRTDESKSILMEELRNVADHERLAADPDGFIAKSARYYQAAMIGAAHKNLRILARLIVGRNSLPGLTADEFLSFAGVIESLRADELDVLAAFIRERHRREGLNASDMDSDYWPKVEENFKGTIITKPELLAIATSLTRTGFIMVTQGFGGGTWNVTPILLRLERTVQFNDAIIIARSDTV